MRESGESSPGGSCDLRKLRYFFRILMPSHIRERQLPIPRKFVSKFGKELSYSVLLKGPSGKTWGVTLKKKTDGGIWFQNGWQEFVEYYSLCEGYFLAFRYDGNSKFEVVVFDRSACQKKYPHRFENAQNSNIGKGIQASVNKREEELVGILGAKRSHKLTERNENRGVQGPSLGAKRDHLPTKRKDYLGSEEDSVEILSVKTNHTPTKTSSTKSQCNKHKYRDESLKLKSPRRFVGSEDHISTKRRHNVVSEKEREEEESSVEVLGAKRNHTPPKRSSTCEMEPPHQCRNEFIKSKSSRGFVESEEHDSTKRRVNVVAQSRLGHESESTCMKHSARLNSVKSETLGCDITVESENRRTKPNENIWSSKSSYFNRHEARSKEFVHATTSNSTMGKVKTEVGELTKSSDKCEPRRSKEEISMEEVSCGPENQRRKPRAYSLSKSDDSSSESPNFGSYRRCFLSKRRPVTSDEREKATQAANAFKSGNPFFTVLMTPSYVCKGFRMHIPTNFVQSYLPKESKNIILRVSKGKRRLVRCSVRKGRSAIGKGWESFVWENNLEEGDVCVFELIKTKGTEMKVHIFRVIDEIVPLEKWERRRMENK